MRKYEGKINIINLGYGGDWATLSICDIKRILS